MSQLIDELQQQVELNLSASDAPTEFVTPDIAGILIEILVEFLASCLGGLGKKSVVARMQKPGFYQRYVVKREIRRQIFDNSRRKYQLNNGDALRDSLLDVSAQATPEQCQALVDEVSVEVPDIDYDLG